MAATVTPHNPTWDDSSTAATAHRGARLLTRRQCATFPDGMTLVSGEHIAPLQVAYETFGTLSPQRDNAILIVHALTGDSHCAGFYDAGEKKPGWWDPLIGPGKAFDTNKYFIICSNDLGGCQGTTGPSSVNPATGARYGMRFPVITMRDIVNTQKLLLESLGIRHLLCISGGSMGGMNALEWAAAYPDWMSSIIPVSTSGRLSPQGLAFSFVERQAIMRDPKWRGGAYAPEDPPADGLAVARMIGHITYLSSESMTAKFGRRLKGSVADPFNDQFEVESYLNYQGERFVERFDANSYIYLTKAMDYYDIAENCAALEEGAARMRCKALFVSFRSDWLFTPRDTAELVDALRKVGRDAEHHEIESAYGHDAFLVEYPKYAYLLARFLERVYKYYN
jgi:homoserine O-acetyltransferase